MHITEGIVTGTPAVLYTAAGLALVGYGITKMKKFVVLFPEKQPLLGMAGALIFFFSLLPIPAFTGTCSHPCATPFIAILFGPAVAIALAGGSLLLQAAFFAHGGFGTWGANVVALGLFGGLAGWSAFCFSRKIGFPLWAAGFAGGLIGNFAVYAASGFILAGALAHAPTPQYSFIGYLIVIYAAYMPTQLPIGLGEMVITGLALHYMHRQRPEVLIDLGLVKDGLRPSGNNAKIGSLSLFLLTTLLIMPSDLAIAVNEQGGQEREKGSPQIQLPVPVKSFTGMDEAVNENLAEKAGLKLEDPLINIESMGDSWNALLLIAGGFCGFVIGRWWHLITKRVDSKEETRRDG
jgi:cobalt/nickel transport system permease protein